MSRLLLILLMLCVYAGMLCSCNLIDGNNSADPCVSLASEAASESDISSSNESSTASGHIDSFYEETVFIKCGDVSDMPNYESVYQFRADGTMLYSKNIYSGFSQSEAQYYIRRYTDTDGYEIWYYYNNKKDYAVKLFSVDGNDKINFNDTAPTCFINQTEFNTVFAFHKEWNEDYE